MSAADSSFHSGRRGLFRSAVAATAVVGLTGGAFAAGQTTSADSRRRAPALPQGLPFTFQTEGYQCVLDVPDALQPWRTRTAAKVDTNPHDATGVRMFKADGRMYDHPVGQIQFGLENLASHRRTGDPFYLQRAKLQAQRLIEQRHLVRGAWFFPYPFDFRHQVHTGVEYKAPWYSGMAQGEALSLFAQLAAYKGIPGSERARYRAAADGAFASLLVADDTSPWVVARDEKRQLWIHEYPIDAPGVSDYTYNGFMFAALGLWDYHTLSRNPLAEQLFDGSLSTLAVYFPMMRNPGGLSHYCRTHTIPTKSYHRVHSDLLLQLSWLSGSQRFAAQSDLLIDDFPPASLGKAGGRVTMQDGTHSLYRFAENGAITARRSLTLSRSEQCTATRRTRIPGRGIHLQIEEGPAAGWHIREQYPSVRLHGEWCASDYRPARQATISAGVNLVCRSGPEAKPTSRTVTYPRDTALFYDRRAVIDSRPMVRLAGGSLGGWWAPTEQLTLSDAV